MLLSLSNAWFAPFRCRFAVLLYTVAVLPFRSYLCRCTRGLKTSFCIHIGMKWPEDWLAVRLRQNGKNGIRSYLLRNGSYGATAGGNGNGTTEFFYVSNVILNGAHKSLCANLYNGNGETATAERQRNGDKTRHKSTNGKSCIQQSQVKKHEHEHEKTSLRIASVFCYRTAKLLWSNLLMELVFCWNLRAAARGIVSSETVMSSSLG